MTRILFFVSSMQGGGAERVAALLCNRWAEQGHDVLLVPTYSGRGTCLYPLDPRVRLTYLADLVGTTRKNLLTMAQRLHAMRQLAVGMRAESVVAFLPHVNATALLATRGLGLRVVVSERSYPPARTIGLLWTILRRLTYPWASTVVMQTRQGLDWLASAIPRAEGAVIPNPCVFPLPAGEPSVSPGTILPRDRRLLLAVGRLSSEKQFDLLISAFATLATRFPDWNLAIVGDGPELAALQQVATKAGLAGRIHLPGRVGNVGDWYARADLYAMTSRFEGFPNTLLEAMAAAVPAVSFDCTTGPSDLIRHGHDGYLVPPTGGTDTLAEHLADLMSDPTKRQAFGARAADVRHRFSMASVGVDWDRAVLGAARDAQEPSPPDVQTDEAT